MPVFGAPFSGLASDRKLPVDGQCGVPSGAVAVSANVTVVGASGRGDLRMFPTGTPVPTASVINFNAGSTRASNAILPMVGNPVGSLTVQCDIPSGTTNMLLDVNGYFQYAETTLIWPGELAPHREEPQVGESTRGDRIAPETPPNWGAGRGV